MRPGENTDLIMRRIFEKYDEIGWENAPEEVLKKVLDFRMKH